MSIRKIVEPGNLPKNGEKVSTGANAQDPVTIIILIRRWVGSVHPYDIYTDQNNGNKYIFWRRNTYKTLGSSQSCIRNLM